MDDCDELVIRRGAAFDPTLVEEEEPGWTWAGKVVRLYLTPPAGDRLVFTTEGGPLPITVSGDGATASINMPGTWTASADNLPVDGLYKWCLEIDDRASPDYRLRVVTPAGGPLL